MPTNHTDPLRTLARSTKEFMARFGVTPQIDDSLMNFEEETAEFIEAVRDGTNADHIAEEAADVFVTAINACFAAGIDIEKLVDQVYYVARKNDAKTHETHHHVDGKIRRK